jgi:hypothetical protein
MVSFDQESKLTDPIAAYVRRKSFRLQIRELQFYEYKIDIFGFSSQQNLTIAIELKLLRWRRAVEQALLYQLCADRVFIALPYENIGRVDTDILTMDGIGLLAVEKTGRCRMILDAKQSKVLRPHYRDVYVKLLKGSH